MILSRFLSRSQANKIGDLYGAIVAQARAAAFYRDYGVPDTVEGRFDLIVLHLVLALARLEGEEGAGRGVGQALFDVFCSDLDANLREMGVGDLAVPKRMKKFGEAFYGRQAAYLEALVVSDLKPLEKALARNIFGENDSAAGAARLARYARAVLALLEDQQDDALLRGAVVFPAPEAIT
ncbi:MAG TPA: ubiquinol-cytochrome C chaperone family protein [Xanthobacteraceae bacterium]|jgi:cytochrome b pre-mRNA-processing protein 3|nr:ubiquinol-cytochrome C chaperone family protein [Xanthobacteraceae bacterium]